MITVRFKRLRKNLSLSLPLSIFVLLAGSAFSRLSLALLHGPIITDDSFRYLPVRSGGEGFDWLGTQGSPAPLIQIINFLPRTPSLLIQVGFSALAWGTMAIIFSDQALSSRSRLLRSGVIVLLSWLPFIVLYDLSVLTDSVSISGAVLFIATAYSFVFPPKTKHFRIYAQRYMTLGFMCSCLARPVNFLLLAPVLVAAIILRKQVISRKRFFHLVSNFGAVALAVVLLSLGGRGSDMEYLRSINRLAWRSSEIYLAAAEQNGLVFCDQTSRRHLVENFEASFQHIHFGPLRFRTMGGDREVQSNYARNYIAALECQSVESWLRSRSSSPLAMFFASPVENLRQWWADLPSQQLSDSGRFSGAGNRIESLAIPLATFTVVLLLLANAVRSRLNKVGLWDGGERRQRARFLSVIVLATISFSVITWSADQMEVGRHFLPAPLVILMALLLLLPSRPRGEEKIVHSSEVGTP